MINFQGLIVVDMHLKNAFTQKTLTYTILMTSHGGRALNGNLADVTHSDSSFDFWDMFIS